jgi:iron complex outermembrane receptor protein
MTHRGFTQRLIAMYGPALVLGVVVLPASVRAQQAARDSVHPNVIAPVVVTVLRTPLDVVTAPFAVASNGVVAIRRARAGLAADEALATIPGVQVDNRYNFALGERISIRGFGARASFGVRGVKVLIDGIPATLPDGQTTLNHLDLGTLGRAEVIRGPAASLYGNASGGVIQFESELPAKTPYGGSLQSMRGADGLARVQATTSGSDGNRSYLFSASRLRYGGFRTWDDADNWHLNSLVRIESHHNSVGIVVNGVDYTSKNPGALTKALVETAARDSAATTNLGFKTGESGRQGQIGVTWRRMLSSGELRLAAHALRRELDNPIPFRIIDLTRGAGGVRASYAAGVPGLSWARWIAGTELELQRDARKNFTNTAGARGALSLDQGEHVTSTGTFVQLTGQPVARVEIVGGVRYDRLRFSASDHLITQTNPDDSGERTMDAVSPSIGVSVALRPDVRVYANAGTSFETPTTTELANRPSGAGGFNPDLEPQRTRSVEAGAKGVVGSRVVYQVAVFRATVRDGLIPFEVPAFAGRQFFRNAGSAVHRGVEAGATLLLGTAMEGRIAYTYTNARFREYVTSTASYSGDAIPGIAPHRLDVAFNTELGHGAFVDVDARYSSAMFADDGNLARSPGYAVAGMRTGIDAVRVVGFDVAPFIGVTNIFDRTFNTSLVINATGARYYEPAPPRSWYAGATMLLGGSRKSPRP